MLLPGTIKHYRVDAEFENIDDLELEHLIHQAKQRRDDALWLIPLIIVVFVWITALLPIGWLLFVTLRGAARAIRGPVPAAPPSGFDPDSFAGALAISLTVVVGVASTAAAWIWIRRWLIIRSIRLLRHKTGCPYCGFDLRGLKIVDSRLVRCPECGELINFGEFGLSKADLAVEPTRPPQPVSGYLQPDSPRSRVIPAENDPAPNRSPSAAASQRTTDQRPR
ncbi:MAG: hypothetical protein AB7G11_08040 [Phycisphaerales bacterium]